MQFPDSEIEYILDFGFSFTSRPDPIAASLRPDRRVALLLLLLSKSRGRKSSWKGLHLLNWAVRSAENMDLLLMIEVGTEVPDTPVVRIEPALDRSIDLAVGLGYVAQASGRTFQLTSQGQAAATEIEKSEAFVQEKNQLKKLRGKVTQAQVNRLLEWRQS